MQVDNILILAAGKGTRMGNIGQDIPKVIWPIFNRSIIELEILYAKTFQPKNIFINTFHYKEKVIGHLKKSEFFPDINIIEELEELDIGGAVHNLAEKLNYRGNLLILNSDQFIFLQEEIKASFLSSLTDSDCVLLTYNVSKEDGYNALNIEDEQVKGVIPNAEIRTNTFETYTGMSFINLEVLNKTKGKSKFFESVVNFDKKIKPINIKKSHYWDFGTLSRYYKSIFGVCSKIEDDQKDMFVDFLISTNTIDPKLVGKKSYNNKSPNVINFTAKEVECENTIVLSDSPKKNHQKKSILSGSKEDIIP